VQSDECRVQSGEAAKISAIAPWFGGKLVASRIIRSAEVSECGRYRWWLRRGWQLLNRGEHVIGRGVCCFVMLNPSTADDTYDDPTIRRCVQFATRWGYDALSVRNLFPWRATDPGDLFGTDLLDAS
jgi:hypothetical protein